jgi:serine/threonine protein phosphatase 1
LEEQAPEDLVWIREDFLDSDETFPFIVVHGHTPCEEPEIRHNRIGIDTGAFATGRLTALVLEGDRHRMLTITGRPI